MRPAFSSTSFSSLLIAAVVVQSLFSLLVNNGVSRNYFDYYFGDYDKPKNETSRTQLSESLSILPEWMEDYVHWHQDQRRNLTNETKYLVVRCLVGDKCGGVSDRLKPLPFFVLLANATSRVLLIYWEKPAPLDEFLVPPVGGLDWRLSGTNVTFQEVKNPDTFNNGFCNREGAKDYIDCVATHPEWSSQRVLSILPRGGFVIRSFHHWFHKLHGVPEEEISDTGLNSPLIRRANVTVPSNYDLMRDLFRVLFEPSPAVKHAMQEEMTRVGIEPGKYVTAHVRAKAPKNVPDGIQLGIYGPGYGNNIVDMRGGVVFEGQAKEFFVNITRNAVNCAANLAPGLPVYVVSDTNDVVRYMAKENNNIALALLASNRRNDTLHVDYDPNAERNASDFYDTFVDLLIMSKAKCASHGIGGFGLFPVRIGGINCTIRHREGREMNKCPEPNATTTKL